MTDFPIKNILTFSEAVSHFSILHKCASGLDGKLILASYGEALAPIVKNFPIGDIEGMKVFAEALAMENGRNIYMPLAVMRSDLKQGYKGSENDVIALLGMVADFDHGKGLVYKNSCPFEPSYVLETSPNNAQCFFLFDKPFLIKTESDRIRLKELTINFTGHCIGADTCGMDISHVWRIPSLLNWPNKNKLLQGRDPNPFVVRILKPFDDTRIPMADIESMPIIEKTPAIKKTSNDLEYKKKIELKDLQNAGGVDLVKLIERPIPSGQRSEAVSSLVWSLLNRGYGTGDIANIIYQHPNGIGERYNNDLKRIEVDVLRLSDKKYKNAPIEEEKKQYTLQALGVINESKIRPRPWILGAYLIKGKVTLIIAPPGVGKSTMSLTLALCISTNRNLLGINVYESGAVGIINNEDDIEEMQRRLAALQKFYRIKHSDLEDKFFIQSGETQQFIIAKRDHNSKAMYDYHKEDLILFCKEYKIKALFIDPFLETHEADENDNRQISEVVKMYREVAQKADCAICIVHHTRKQQGESSKGHAGNMDSGRGASSLIGAARIVLTLYDMSEGDAKQYGISEDERHLYIRLDYAKANLSLKSNQALWYCRETVILDNGDNVGIIKTADNLKLAIAETKSTIYGVLFYQINSHEDFEGLRVNGKMKREAFINAMIKSNACLGRKTKVRSSLQNRTHKHLMGNGITDGTMKIYMSKHDNFYTIHYEEV